LGRLPEIGGEVDRPRVDELAKRLLDAAAAALLLLALLPVLIAVAVAVRATSRGPVFFRSPRVGRNGCELRMLKFRKMHDGATGAALTTADDERFTMIGRFLAKSKLDELPQLWNVLKGDMSLVGPRPEDSEFVAARPSDFRRILTVRPGITGLAQLAFAKESEILDVEDRCNDYIERLLPQKIALDHLYVAQRSLLMDVRILVWTFIAVLLRRDVAVSRTTGALSLRRARAQAPVPAASAAAESVSS
jgi:lipopolysaccharide/colanic/teichoic acid biosynthesis glycosyltransferase